MAGGQESGPRDYNKELTCDWARRSTEPALISGVNTNSVPEEKRKSERAPDSYGSTSADGENGKEPPFTGVIIQLVDNRLALEFRSLAMKCGCSPIGSCRRKVFKLERFDKMNRRAVALEEGLAIRHLEFPLPGKTLRLSL
ncbi:hypothetical protein MJT46_003914 [Ovis ammon polii x Ovis aries]|nr:hypothetical protein MJT46_003914 [Ovis ammon polii x Ovis aries]